jgi:hypothetical protein
MAGVERFELPTVGFGDRCSTNWNYTPKILHTLTEWFLDCLGKIRVTLEVSPLLYSVKHYSQVVFFTPHTLLSEVTR